MDDYRPKKEFGEFFKSQPPPAGEHTLGIPINNLVKELNELTRELQGIKEELRRIREYMEKNRGKRGGLF